VPRRWPGRGESGGGWALDAADVQGAAEKDVGDVGCGLDGAGFFQGDAFGADKGEARGQVRQAWLNPGGGAAFNGDDEQVFHGGW